MTPTAHHVLEDVYELLSDPSRWTKGYDARTSTLAPVSALHPNATCWCLKGAIQKCSPTNNPYIELEANQLLRQHTPNRQPLTDFNDDHFTTHADVLALIRKVIPQ